MNAHAEIVPSLVDRIKKTLVGLKMPRAIEILDVTLRRIEQGEMTAIEAIDALLAEELMLRESRRIKTAADPASQVASGRLRLKSRQPSPTRRMIRPSRWGTTQPPAGSPGRLNSRNCFGSGMFDLHAVRERSGIANSDP